MSFTRVSKEAEEVLMEILEHEHDSDYWKIRFDRLSNRDDIVLNYEKVDLSIPNMQITIRI